MRLFLLVTILSQTFLTFVSSHLVAFSFFTAGHFVVTIKKFINKKINSLRDNYMDVFPILFHIFHEHLSRLESGDVVLGDDDGCIL